MSLELIEGVVTAVKGYLESNMPSKVAALNAAYADDVTLADVAQFSDYELVQPGQAVYPCIEVLGLETTPLQETANLLRSEHRLVIVCSVADDTGRGPLRKRTERYGRGIYELLKASDATLNAQGYSRDLERWRILQPPQWSRGDSRVIAPVFIEAFYVIVESYP